MSTSTSHGSLNKTQSSPRETMSLGKFEKFSMSRSDFNFIPEDAISPMEEIGEPEFTLDMNLDDMSGIVDPSRANGPPAPAPGPSGPGAPPILTTTPSDQTVVGVQTPPSSIFLHDPLSGSFSVSQSGSEGSSDSAQSSMLQSGRSILVPTERSAGDTFARSNPFQSVSPHGSIDGKARTPPSPHTLTLSPKHALPLNTAPRRPSQLRNVKMGSIVSESSSDGPESAFLQPLAPAWAQQASGSGMTLFHDPFKNNMSIPNEIAEGISPSGSTHRSTFAASQVSMQTSGSSESSTPENKPAATAAAAVTGANAAWAAPESWGVEGDDEPDDATSSEEDDWAEGDNGGAQSTQPDDSVGELMQPHSSGSSRSKPPPFGFKSAGHSSSSGANPRPGTGRKGIVKASSGRPSTSQRPNTAGGRPGTSGSAHVANVSVSSTWIVWSCV